MSSTPSHDAQSSTDLGVEPVRSLNLLDYVFIAAKYKKLILKIIIGSVALCAILFWVVIPRWYKSTASILPPKQKNMLGMLGSFTRATSSLRSLGIGALPADDLADFQTILLSRRVLEDVVTQFKLMDVYDVDSIEKAVKELRTNIEVVRGKQDVSLEIVAYDTDPQRAAQIANFLVEKLDKVYAEISNAEARSNREFIERRYKQNLSDLQKAEEEYKQFQQRYKIFSVPEQMKAAVTAAATLQSQVVLKEIELGVLSNSTTADNPDRQKVQIELRELRKQLKGILNGQETSEIVADVIPPLAKAPEIGIEYLRRYREVEIQGKILELLVPIYEQAKIEEQRNTPTVLILDSAVPSEKPSKPKRLLLSLIIVMLCALLGFVFCFYQERHSTSLSRLSETDKGKIDFIKRELHWRNLFR
ncbi:MAG TPA: GNVR domain-containing protein [Bacteroidota bacterium]|nr:GNVR domain-containing protein [Bacteroidota bacterium]